jgi:hypothetical protein
MQLAKIKEQTIQYGYEKEIITDEDLINDVALEDVIVQSIAAAKEMAIAAKKTLSKINYWTTEIPYDSTIQDNPSKEHQYELPRAILGRYDYVSSINGNHNIRISPSLPAHVDTLHCQIQRETRGVIENTTLIIDNANVGDLKLQFLPVDPRECNNFNVYKDDFPADSEIILKGIQILYELNLNRVINVVKDTKTDSTDSAK